jgi:hypothetical protein
MLLENRLRWFVSPRQSGPRRTRLRVELLEDRTVPAIVWVNRLTATDTFTPQERAVIDQAIAIWNGDIADFNNGNNTLNLTVTGGRNSGLNLGTNASGGKILGQAGPSFFPGQNPSSGTMEIDGTVPFYVDPNPADNTEFTRPLNDFAAQNGPAGPDLLYVALHEIGHAVGIINIPQVTGRTTANADGRTTTYRGADGFTVVLDTPPAHTDTAANPNDLMNPSAPEATRVLPTALDLAFLKSAYGYTVNAPLNLSGGRGSATPAAPNTMPTDGSTPVPKGATPISTVATAQQLPAARNLYSITGALPAGTPADFYRFAVLQGGSVWAAVDPSGGGAPTLAIVDANGTVVAGPTANGVITLANVPAAAAGDLFLRVTSDTPLASYKVSLYVQAQPSTDEDPAGGGNRIGTAENRARFGNLAAANEVDTYRFEARAGDTVLVAADGRPTPADPGTDVVLQLVAPDGSTSLLPADAGGPGVAESLSFQATQTGTYQVRVSGKNGSTGRYTLLVAGNSNSTADPVNREPDNTQRTVPPPAPAPVQPVGDVTSLVPVANEVRRANRPRTRTTLQLELLNNSGATLTGPLFLRLGRLPRGVRALGASGTSSLGTPFFAVSLPGGSLAPGQTVTVTVTLGTRRGARLGGLATSVVNGETP